jgi:hypothetical protein
MPALGLPMPKLTPPNEPLVKFERASRHMHADFDKPASGKVDEYLATRFSLSTF